MTKEIVTLNQQAIRTEIEHQITQVASGNHSMAHDKKLFDAIENISDNQIKGELLHKFLDALTQHQGEKNQALRKEVESRIKISELYANHEISKDKARTELFNSRILVMFAWTFPIIAGFISIKLFESFVFATFIIIILYGVLIALYFSQSNGLAETWKALTSHRRDL